MKRGEELYAGGLHIAGGDCARGEGKGLHELTRKRCDFVVSLPTVGPVKSLNVSVAAGVVLFERCGSESGCVNFCRKLKSKMPP